MVTMSQSEPWNLVDGTTFNISSIYCSPRRSGSKKGRMTAILVIAFLGGFHGGRDVALSQLRSCWEEGGIQARPISGPEGPVMVV